MNAQDIIDECKTRWEACVATYDGDRAMALDDLRFRNGDQWDEESVRQRELDGRPCLTVNNIPSIIHQITGDVRQNRMAIHVHPVDGGADIETAQVIEGIIRHIEYDSAADAAYDTALDNAVSIGFGFFRLITEYCDPMSFDQDIKISRIRNPFTVYIDPDAVEADASDMRYCIIASKVPKVEFERLYPGKDPTIDYIVRGTGDDKGWVGQDYVRIAEYYRIEETKETLVQLSDGSVRLATDKTPLPVGVVPVATRETYIPKIMWYKLTAREVLESVEIACDWIPVFPVYGDEIDIDGKVTRSGLIRNAKDPARMYNYWITSATEEIALRTKTPFIGAIGQFEGVEEDWNAANNRSLSYLEYNPVTVDGNIAPAPQRQPPADVPTGFIAMAGLARDNVKAVTGIYDASLGNRSNETSGIAINARKRQGEVGNFHFSDNLTRAIRHMGRCIVSMLPFYYDTPRVIRILGEDNSPDTAEVNKPVTEMNEQGQAVERVLNDLTVGTYDVIVSTGPAYNTLREESADQLLQLAGNFPALMEKAGDLVLKSMDFPMADEISERIAPPGADKDDDEAPMVQTPNGPIPLEQAGQLIGQMDQALDQMQADMERLESGLEKARLDNESRERIAEMNNATKLDDTELRGMLSLLMAKMDPILAHQAAVIAADDPMHPAPPAQAAQTAAAPPPGMQERLQEAPPPEQQEPMQ